MVSYNLMKREWELLPMGYASYLIDHPDTTVVAHFVGSVPIYAATVKGDRIVFIDRGFDGALKQFVNDNAFHIPNVVDRTGQASMGFPVIAEAFNRANN